MSRHARDRSRRSARALAFRPRPRRRDVRDLRARRRGAHRAAGCRRAAPDPRSARGRWARRSGPCGAGTPASSRAIAWQVLWPRAGPVPSRATRRASSCGSRRPRAARAVRSAAALTMVFLGDLGAEPQSGLLAAGSVGRVDVVKVAHHGSADQTERLYRALAAPIALIGGRDRQRLRPPDGEAPSASSRGSAPRVGRTDTDGPAPRVPFAGRRPRALAGARRAGLTDRRTAERTPGVRGPD